MRLRGAWHRVADMESASTTVRHDGFAGWSLRGRLGGSGRYRIGQYDVLWLRDAWLHRDV